MSSLTIVDHPLLKRDLTVLRRRDTPHGVFRSTLSNVAAILAYEAMRDLPLQELQIETPLEATSGYVLGTQIVIVPILRAGLGMIDGFLRFVPDARVGHLGMYRDEETRRPVDYYSSIPSDIEAAEVFVTDPMLATGGSAANAISFLKNKGANRLHFVCLVAAPEGVDVLQRSHPDVPIIAAALDRQLDSRAFIRPGLGDAGDRIFGTGY